MNIFIAGLNYNMSEAELGELFAEYGEVVSVKIIMDRETGRSKGYKKLTKWGEYVTELLGDKEE